MSENFRQAMNLLEQVFEFAEHPTNVWNDREQAELDGLREQFEELNEVYWAENPAVLNG